MKMFKPGWRRALAAVAAGVLIAGCSTDNASQNQVPAQEGTPDALVVYSGRSESLVAELFAQFTTQTGIPLEVRYADSGELAALLLTEGSSSPADVYFSQDAGALGAVENADLLDSLPEDVVSLVDSRFRSASGKWVATSGRARVVVYNPSLVTAVPKSIDDLLDPMWKGKIGFAPTNASWQSFVTALRVIRGEDAARAWLEGFKANDPVAYEKNGAVRDAVNSGEVAIGLVNHYYLYEKIAAEGADAVVARNHYFTNGDVGGLVNVAGIGVLSSSGNKEAALELVKFLLSAQGQQYFALKTFEYALAAGVASYSELPTLEELNPPAIDLSDLRSINETQELLAGVGLLTL
jgi:iron(III) transport system substrate-binding protein